MDGGKFALVFVDPWDIPVEPSSEIKHTDTNVCKIGAAALVMTAVTASMDLKITRSQLNTPSTTISANRGYSGTFFLSLIKNSASLTLAFTLLPEIRKYLENERSYDPATAKIGAGFATGLAQSIILSPLTTIWTLHCANKINSTNDIPKDARTLFKGTSATITRNVLYWTLFPIVNDRLLESSKGKQISPALIGAIAGIVATLVSYPIDTISKLLRKQDQTLAMILRGLSDKPQKVMAGAPLCFARMAFTSAIISSLGTSSVCSQELK